MKDRPNVAVSVLDSIAFHHHLNACPQNGSIADGVRLLRNSIGASVLTRPADPKRIELLASRISPIELPVSIASPVRVNRAAWVSRQSHIYRPRRRAPATTLNPTCLPHESHPPPLTLQQHHSRTSQARSADSYPRLPLQGSRPKTTSLRAQRSPSGEASKQQCERRAGRRERMEVEAR